MAKRSDHSGGTALKTRPRAGRIVLWAVLAALLLGAVIGVVSLLGRPSGAETPENTAAPTAAPEPTPAETPAPTAEPAAPYSDLRYLPWLDEYAQQTYQPGEYTAEDLYTYTYNTGTIFAGAEDEAAALLEEDKDPGLGVRGLQAQGITGKGVRAAIIDQPLLTDHPELSGRIAAYYDTGCEGETSSMHGPAVASLFAGESIGIAPDATLYYAAWPSWLMDSRYAAEALDWVVAQNEALPDGEKIRVVSVSAAPGNAEMFQNADLWDAAVARAEQAGLLVLTVDGAGVEKTRLVPYPAVLARNDRDNPAACRTGFADSDERAETGSNTLSLPCSYRTVAEEYTAGQYSYTHDGHGGLSWGIPYCAGVMALGWQVDPTLTGEEMMQYLLSTAATGTDGSHIIDPVQFIQTLQTERGA